MKCARCQAPTDLECEGCKMINYCGEECQKIHWDNGTHDARACRIAGQESDAKRLKKAYPELSNEAMTVIFNNLDINEVFDLRLVSKRFKYIIDSDHFIYGYLRHNQSKRDEIIFSLNITNEDLDFHTFMRKFINQSGSERCNSISKLIVYGEFKKVVAAFEENTINEYIRNYRKRRRLKSRWLVALYMKTPEDIIFIAMVNSWYYVIEKLFFRLNDEYKDGALWTALNNEDLMVLTILVQSGVDVNTWEYGRSILSYTISEKETKHAAILLSSSNVNVNIKDHLSGWTPLMWAVKTYSLAEEKAVKDDLYNIIVSLLEKGADPRIQNRNGVDAVHFATDQIIKDLF